VARYVLGKAIVSRIVVQFAEEHHHAVDAQAMPRAAGARIAAPSSRKAEAFPRRLVIDAQEREYLLLDLLVVDTIVPPARLGAR